MMVDPEGKFVMSIFIWSIIIGAIIGGTLGGYTAIQNGAELGSQQFWMGVGTGVLIGGAVGAIAGITLAGGGLGYLTGGLSSVVNKFISDITSSVFYGTNNFGSWEDYAVAFVIGGVIKGRGSIGLSKWGLDAVARPFLNQLTKMGTRGAEFNAGRFAYDVVSRSLTIGMGNNMQIFGLEMNPSKAIIRGLFSGLGRIIYD